MPYEPTVWKSGDIVTSAKLNKLEQGVVAGGSGGGFLKVGMNMETMTLDKTWKEIYEALGAGYYVSVTTVSVSGESVEQVPVTTSTYDGADYYAYGSVVFEDVVRDITYKADSENGYPVMQQ